MIELGLLAAVSNAIACALMLFASSSSGVDGKSKQNLRFGAAMCGVTTLIFTSDYFGII